MKKLTALALILVLAWSAALPALAAEETAFVTPAPEKLKIDGIVNGSEWGTPALIVDAEKQPASSTPTSVTAAATILR